jgi:succinoglycan biosynthesis transport protein ExoP
MDPEQPGLSSKLFLGIMRRRAPLILICFLVGAGGAYGYSKRESKKYTATAVLTFNNNPIDEEIVGLSVGGSASLLAQQASNRELVSVGNMAEETARLLGHGLTYEQVRESVEISAQGETSTVNVSTTSTSATLAAAIANTYTRLFVKEQNSENRRFFKSALTVVNKQLARLSPAQRFGSDGLDLQERAHTLGLLAELGSYNSAQVAQEALAPSNPSSPKTKRNTILGAVLGLVIGFGIALLLERLDRRIREPHDLEVIYGLPVLGVVPKSAALARSSKGARGKETALPAAEAEAFNLIRAHLRFFNVDRDLRTLLIASPEPGDGKTTIARCLAEAAARLGSRVLLLEVDLRHPTLAQQLDVQPSPGLAGTLIGSIAMDEATQSVAVGGLAGEGGTGRTLDVLVAGAVLPPNPGELLESRAMDVLLTRARSAYDLVMIDTPPLVAVSDAFPLLTKVDGVVIVGRIGHSRPDVSEQLQQVLAGSGAPILGVVANGSNSSGMGAYAEAGGNRSSPDGISANGIASAEEFVSRGT